MATTTTAAEITKLVGAAADAARKAVGSADGSTPSEGGAAPPAATPAAVADRAEEGRAVDALKALARLPVTAALLRDTDAGKRVNRLCKSASSRIADAASAAVAAWKASVRAAAGGGGGGGGGGSAAVVKAEPAHKATTKSGGDNGGSEPTTTAAPSTSQGTAAAAAAAEPATTAAAAAAPTPPPPPREAPAAAADPSAPPPHDPPPRTGDARRDKLRAVLAAALALALPEIEADGGAEPDEDGYVELPRGAAAAAAAAGAGGNGANAATNTPPFLPGRDAPGRVAAAIEEELLRGPGAGSSQSPAYAARGRSLAFNLRAPDNPALRRRALLGSLPPERLASMSPEEMASDARRRENEAMREKGKWEAVRGNLQQAATTDQFQCGKCKQRKTTFFQLQTRSADEPMTTFVTCVVCNNRWKFC
jgi:transcription elongation factor S-II